jgi:bifunctional DNA-binding transcriptional regulator/antitoxin component of YhaV-PrlF toxin-antitoxin module
MPAKVKRKIITETGLVSLPKAYRDYHQLEKGDEVTMLYDNVLVVTPKNITLSKEKAQALKELLE